MRELSKEEVIIFDSMVSLYQRKLRDYLVREGLVPDEVMTYAAKGYNDIEIGRASCRERV